MTLAPGVSIFDLDGTAVLRTPDGEFLAVNAEVGPDLGGLAPAVAEAFSRAGFLAPDSECAPAAVAVAGDGLIAQSLAGLVDRTPLSLVPSIEEADVVSWACDGLPPQREWAALDAEVGRIAWQRCSVEGATAVIEPIAVAPGDVTHEHVRLRRLAASDSPGHLAAYWATTPLHAAPAVTPVTAAFVASLLAADLLAWAHGHPRTRTLRLADLRTQRVADHPILPVPPHDPRREVR
ncbi:hypothetical protein [Thermoactinospora rubra]|uniref:hypothetical protein n=1 Tax=Thermoactinospora rubra TaxID=1088767 RepID=UPI000A100C2B|nr:hypothetical protein [Thermoactinospora rubra]